MSQFVVVIPSRFASQRLPGKPLRRLAGKPMLQHVYERAMESGADQVIIATDDERIVKAARIFGADVCMTSNKHQSGTDRIAEVCALQEWTDNQIVVNLQGDEPMMPAPLIGQCAALLDDDEADLATLASPFESVDDFRNPNVVKVVTDDDDFALYFSRSTIPYSRQSDTDVLAMGTARQHHGIYAYRVRTLRRIVSAPQSDLEKCEQLEQLRALSLGLRIKLGMPSMRPGPGIDTEEDLKAVESMMQAASNDLRPA